jgi:hypothetical protein
MNERTDSGQLNLVTPFYILHRLSILAFNSQFVGNRARLPSLHTRHIIKMRAHETADGCAIPLDAFLVRPSHFACPFIEASAPECHHCDIPIV